MLPTYAQHAGRRVTEMRELATTMSESGLEPCVVAAVGRLHEQLARTLPTGGDAARTDTATLMIETLAAHGLLSTGPDPAAD
jgi:hypothetical protein